MSGRRATRRDLRKLGIAIEVDASRLGPRAHRLDLVLPFPPSTNALYPTIVTREGTLRRVKSTVARQYTAQVREEVMLWTFTMGRRPPAPPYRLALTAFPPDDGRKHDVSNLVKCLEDALMAAIGEGRDDNDVVSLSARKEPPSDRPRVVVTLEGEVSC